SNRLVLSPAPPLAWRSMCCCCVHAMGSEEISSLTGSGAEVEEDVKNEDASRARVGTTDSDLCSKIEAGLSATQLAFLGSAGEEPKS
ncbi:unnamed protein product, partial [Ascophyllum nodosum]